MKAAVSFYIYIYIKRSLSYPKLSTIGGNCSGEMVEEWRPVVVEAIVWIIRWHKGQQVKKKKKT